MGNGVAHVSACQCVAQDGFSKSSRQKNGRQNKWVVMLSWNLSVGFSGNYHCLFEEVVKRNHGNVRENNLFLSPCVESSTVFGCSCDVLFSCGACVFVNKAMDFNR